MTTVPYITLMDTSGSGGQFAVVMGGYNPTSTREQGVNKTLGGSYDIAQGANFEVHQYLIRTRHTEERLGYGNLDELRRLWGLNNPNGDPSDLITFIDHFGNNHTCRFQGEFRWGAVTTVLEGISAWYFVPITLMLEPE